MYSSERVAWWAAKTQLDDHQRAYDLIASLIVPTSRSVIIEQGCGNAELLKKIYQRYTQRMKRRNNSSSQDIPLLIGTDITREMLKLAKDNLHRSGIESIFLKDPSNIKNHRGIVLLEDDMTDSQLPPEISDISLLVFPELEIKSGTKTLLEVLPKYAHATFTEFKYGLMNHVTARLTKKGKQVIICDYSDFTGRDSPEERKYLKEEARFAQDAGLRLVRNSFVSSSEAFADVPEDRQAVIRKLGRGMGYRVLIYTKM